jgi:hypothetical protein
MSFFFQGSWGTGSHKNFEVVIPNFGGEGLLHYWRDNGAPGAPWHGPIHFGTGTVSHAAVMESTFGPGDFEVVAVRNQELAFYFRDVSVQWHGPVPIPLPRGLAVSGGPALIQGGGPGPHPVFLLGVPAAAGRVAMLNRDNATGLWGPPFMFGPPSVVHGVDLARYTNSMNTTYTVRASCDGQLWMDWGGPEGSSLVAGSGGISGTPGAAGTDFGSPEVVVPGAKGGLEHFFREYGSDGPWKRYSFGSGLRGFAHPERLHGRRARRPAAQQPGARGPARQPPRLRLLLARQRDAQVERTQRDRGPVGQRGLLFTSMATCTNAPRVRSGRAGSGAARFERRCRS